MITAKLNYRPRNSRKNGYEYPYSISSVEFFGDSNVINILETLSSKIRYEKSDNIKELELKYTHMKQEVINKIEDLKNELKNVKKQTFIVSSHRLVKIIQINKEIRRLEKVNNEYNLEIEKLNADRFYTPFEINIRFSKMLSDLGFIVKNAFVDSNNITVELFEYGGDNNELIKKAQSKIKLMQKNNKISVTDLKQKNLNINAETEKNNNIQELINSDSTRNKIKENINKNNEKMKDIKKILDKYEIINNEEMDK